MELNVSQDLIRELRRKACLTQEELAEASGLHARTIQRLETSGAGSGPSLRAVAAALGVEPAELIGSSPRSSSAATVMRGAAGAFLWVALAVLVWVPTTDQVQLVPIVAIAGFVSFSIGLWLMFRSFDGRSG